MSNNKKHKGSLRLDWINKDQSLYYEIDEKEGKGVVIYINQEGRGIGLLNKLKAYKLE